MSIILSNIPLKQAAMIGAPFCDFLNVSMPGHQGFSVLGEIRPILDVLGLSEVSEGIYKSSLKGGDGGSLMVKKGRFNQDLTVFSVSGHILQMLRSAGFFQDFLMAFLSIPHRITLMHATADYSVDAPAVIHGCYEMGKAEQVFLTRKVVPSRHVKAILSPDQFGRDTGTVYYGHRNKSDVWAKVYDKRHERLCRGAADIGCMTRVEVCITGDIGASLRDVQNPASIYYNFASKTLVEGSLTVSKWVSGAEGFIMEKKTSDFTTRQRMRSIAGGSNDINRMLDIAFAEYGSAHASELFLDEMRYRLRLRLETIKFDGVGPHLENAA